MLHRLVFAAAVFAPAAFGQGTMGDWAVNALLTGSEPQGILSTLNAPILNRPFSASAIVHLSHTLEDGTHINKSTTTALYRDAQGRRRSEGGAIVDIVDPVAGFALRLNSDFMTAIKSENRYVDKREPGADEVKAGTSQAAVTKQTKQGKSKNTGPQPEIETADLGIKVVNGVTAHGVRTSTTIPIGAIGNDRPVKIVKEIWTSSDLRIPVKSIDSDPRFGASTYDLTNILLGPPDPGLFSLQPPPGYTTSVAQAGQVNVSVSYTKK